MGISIPILYIYIDGGPFTVTVGTTEVTKISTRKMASELLGSKWTTLSEKGLESQKEHRTQNHVISNIIYSIHLTWEVLKTTGIFVNMMYQTRARESSLFFITSSRAVNLHNSGQSWPLPGFAIRAIITWNIASPRDKYTGLNGSYGGKAGPFHKSLLQQCSKIPKAN